MSELASYSIQTIFLAFVAIFYFSKSKRLDSISTGLIIFWTVGVIAIFARYRTGQVDFYSNDQAFHQFIVENYIPNEGINIRSTISMRYLITLPAYFFSQFGFNIALIFKFAQLIFSLFTIKHAKYVLISHGISPKNWMFVYISGPLLIFMSLLALRDVILAFFTLLFIFPTNSKSRYFSLLILGLLRPHLALALIFGFCAEIIYRKIKPRMLITSHAIFLLMSYALGALSFPIGDYVMNGNQLNIPSTVFSIRYCSQIGLNLVGMQFLIFDGRDSEVVASSTAFLLFARLIFVDTFLVPSVFLFFCSRPAKILRSQTLQISTAMFFFYGLIFQNIFVTNSTRQNLPFMTVMGLIGVIRIYYHKSRSGIQVREYRMNSTV